MPPSLCAHSPTTNSGQFTDIHSHAKNKSSASFPFHSFTHQVPHIYISVHLYHSSLHSSLNRSQIFGLTQPGLCQLTSSQLLFWSFCTRKPSRTDDLNASARKRMHFGGAIPFFQSGVYKKNKNGHVCLGKSELENEGAEGSGKYIKNYTEEVSVIFTTSSYTFAGLNTR